MPVWAGSRPAGAGRAARSRTPRHARQCEYVAAGFGQAAAVPDEGVRLDTAAQDLSCDLVVHELRAETGGDRVSVRTPAVLGSLLQREHVQPSKVGSPGDLLQEE